MYVRSGHMCPAGHTSPVQSGPARLRKAGSNDDLQQESRHCISIKCQVCDTYVMCTRHRCHAHQKVTYNRWHITFPMHEEVAPECASSSSVQRSCKTESFSLTREAIQVQFFISIGIRTCSVSWHKKQCCKRFQPKLHNGVENRELRRSRQTLLCHQNWAPSPLAKLRPRPLLLHSPTVCKPVLNPGEF
jgi:hypothetical protein